MLNLSGDYFTEIDLNPPLPLPAINSPLDRRAMHYFGFVAAGQEITLLGGLPQGMRVLYSFDYGNAPGIGPVAQVVQANGSLDFAGPFANTVRYEGSHERQHVLVWLDGATAAGGQPVLVRVRAWRKAE